MGALLGLSVRHPRGPEATPRCMGSKVFERNERHAAWELSWGSPSATPAARKPRHAAWEAKCLKETNATLHGSSPGALPGALLAPPPRPKVTQTCMRSRFLEKNERHAHGKHMSPQDRPKSFGMENVDFFENVSFSLEKCRFGANRGVLPYVLKR